MVNCDQFFNFICWDLKLTFLSYLTLGCSRIYQDSVDTSFITNDDEVGTRELSKKWIFRSLKGRAIMWLPLWLVYNIKFKKFQCLFWNTIKILLFFLSNFYDALEHFQLSSRIFFDSLKWRLLTAVTPCEIFFFSVEF